MNLAKCQAGSLWEQASRKYVAEKGFSEDDSAGADPFAGPAPDPTGGHSPLGEVCVAQLGWDSRQ